MFNDDNGIAAVTQVMQYNEQLLDVMEVQAGGRFVENIQRIAGISA